MDRTTRPCHIDTPVLERAPHRAIPIRASAASEAPSDGPDGREHRSFATVGDGGHFVETALNSSSGSLWICLKLESEMT